MIIYFQILLVKAAMVDVTQENFEELWPSIKKSIDQSVLIGIDSEFSGIVSSAKLKNRYVYITVPLGELLSVYLACVYVL